MSDERPTIMGRMLSPYQRVDEDDVGIEPCPPLPCPQCDGVLVNEGDNADGTLTFISCRGRCGFCFVVPLEPAHVLPPRTPSVGDVPWHAAAEVITYDLPARLDDLTRLHEDLGGYEDVRRPALHPSPWVTMAGLALAMLTSVELATSGLPPILVTMGILASVLVFVIAPDLVIAVINDRRRAPVADPTARGEDDR